MLSRYKITILSIFFVCVWSLVSYTKGRSQAKNVRECDLEEDSWICDEGYKNPRNEEPYDVLFTK